MVHLTSCYVTGYELAKMIVMQSDFLSKRLRNDEYVWERKVVAIIEKHSFEAVSGIKGIDIQATTISYFDDFNTLLTPFSGGFPSVAGINYLEVNVSLISLSRSVLRFEHTSAIEHHFLFAKSHEKTKLL